MVKRILIGTVGSMIALVALAVVWQPDFLKTDLAQALVEKATAGQPVALHFARVRGNLFTHLTFDHPELILKRPQPLKLLRAEELRVSVSWLKLLQHQVEVNKLVFVRPTVLGIITPEKRLLLPVWVPRQPASEKSNSGYVIQDLQVKDGTVVIRNEAMDPESELDFKDVNIRAGLSADQLNVGELQMTWGPGSLKGTGVVHLAGSASSGNLSLKTQNWPFETLAAAFVTVPDPLRLHSTGSWDIHFSTSGATLQSKGQLDGATLVLHAESIDKGGKIAVTLGNLASHAIWSADSVRPFSLSGYLHLSAENWRDRRWTGRGEMTAQTAGEPASARATYRLDQGQGPVHLQIKAGALTMSATGVVNAPAESGSGDFQAHLENVPGLAAFVPALAEASGKADAQGHFSMSDGRWAVEAKAQGKDLKIQGKHIDKVEATVHANPAGNTVSIQAESAQWQENPLPWDLRQANLTLEGHAPRWNTSLDAICRNQLEFKTAGLLTREHSAWRYAWSKMDVTPGKGAIWSSTQAGELLARTGSLSITALRLAQGNAFIAFNSLVLSKDQYTAQGSLQDVPLTPWSALVSTRTLDGQVSGKLNVSGPLHALSGTGELSWQNGHVGKWTFDRLSAALRFAPPWIELTRLELLEPPNQPIIITGRIAQETGSSSEGLPMHWVVKAPFIDPTIAAALFPDEVKVQGGHLALDWKADGVWPRLSSEGKLTGEIPQMQFPKVGLEMDDISVAVQSDSEGVTIERFHAKTPKGEINLTGRSRHSNLNFALKADDLRLKYGKSTRARGSLDLALKGTLQTPDLTGSLMLHDGVLSMDDFQTPSAKKKSKNTAETPQVSTPTAHASPLWLASAIDLRGVWDRDVWYRDGLTNIETHGDLRVQKAHGAKEFQLTGNIVSLRGTYNYYGKDFNLESGEVQFAGGPEINPVLNVEASYQSQGTEVYLDVTGPLKNPKLAMHSNPPLTEQDIVSVLLFGRPLSQLNTAPGSGTTNQEMASVAGSIVGSYVTQGLRQTGISALDVDVLNLQSTPTGNQLTVGRYLNRNLFLSYDQALTSQGGTGVKADYFLSDRWTLEGEIGSEDVSYLDFLFRYPLNRRSAKGIGSLYQSPFRPTLNDPNNPFFNTLSPSGL